MPLSGFGFNSEEQEQDLSQKIQAAWAQFVHGNANGSNVWPKYEQSTDASVVWGVDSGYAVVSGIESEQCDFWESIGWIF